MGFGYVYESCDNNLNKQAMNYKTKYYRIEDDIQKDIVKMLDKGWAIFNYWKIREYSLVTFVRHGCI